MRMRYSLASAMCSKHEWHGTVKASEVRDSTKPGLGAQTTGIVNNIERSTTHTLELWHKLQMSGIASAGDAHQLQG